MASELEVGNITLSELHPKFVSSSTASEVTISGGNATSVGANIALRGSTHGTASSVRFRSGTTETLSINSAGQVEVASGNAHISSATQGSLNFGNISTNIYAKVEYDDTNGNFNINNTRAYPLRFLTNDTERMSISSAGLVTCTSANQTTLSVVSSNAGFGGQSINASDGTNGKPIISWQRGGAEKAYDYVGTDNARYFNVNSADRMSIDTTGLATFSNGITISGGLTTLGSFTELTVASGAITVTSSVHSIDTEGNAATDDLVTINGGSDGSVIILRSVTGGRNTTLKDSTDNLRIAGDFTLTSANDTITLVRSGTVWREISRSDNA